MLPPSHPESSTEMSIAALSNRLATFQRKTVTPDALGLGHAEAFSDTYIAKIALQPANGRTIDEFARGGFQVSHMAYTEVVMTLASGDRMLFNGAYYVIVGPERDMGGRGKAYSIPLLLKDQ